MAGMREQESLLYLGQSRGLCRECGAGAMVDVRYMSDGRGVYLERLCPVHGPSRALVAESLGWYLEAQKATAAPRPPRQVLTARGGSCASSCGPCGFHAQRCMLPVFSITNACNLRCPICFTYNRDDATYHMSPEEFRQQIDFLIETTGGVDLIDITGGEPTMHPELFELLVLATRPGIGRVAVNTNGILLARQPELCAKLAEQGVYVVLSVDTLDPARSVRIHGQDLTALKRRALENLARFDVPTTLMMVLIGGVNEDELGHMVEFVLERDFLRSMMIQTMTYTGQGGGLFAPRKHIPVDGVERRIEAATQGRIRCQDFVPLPTAHPLCYSVAYLLRDDDGGVHSFTDLLGREGIAQHLFDGYLMHPTEKLQTDLRAAIERLWSEGTHPALLGTMRQMIRRVYPTGESLSVHERQRRAEQRIKTIYVHAHMDEDTYEVGRAMRCPDQVPVDAKRLIGACNYNLFYRMHDERFWVERRP